MTNKTSILFLLFFIVIHSGFSQENPTKVPEATTQEKQASFWDIPTLKEAYINATPMDRKDGILVGELGVDGGNKEMILKLARHISLNAYGIFDSFLIAHKDKLLFESYFTKGRIDLPHGQASATKTYTSLALGRAIQLGYLTMNDLEKPVASFLKDLDPSTFAEGVGETTLHQALTMTTGIQISDENKEKMRKNPERLKGQGEVQAIFEYTQPITPNAKVFRYGTGPRLVMQIINAVVPGTAEDFIKNELLDKLEITNYNWHKNEETGLPEAGWRTEMTSRAMLKFGILALNKGKWNGQQLISEAFITKAMSKVVDTGDNAIYFGGCKGVSNEGYGYFWWNANLEYEDKRYYCPNAQGGGGQFIILIEELDLIVVATGHNNFYPNTLRMTADRILPAFIKK
ncbi:serine hydrolase domain-containing protein [Aquimarina algicola]|uniref:Serine hydrolase n=1 Tax=Aquimarina algicola TaxID=2589995 RepID=A0A504JR48_9FLAO|nr:serine hydrolase [Aquimarina algicola]TPN88820.1 serine hydrolase [Aquimarina algicola]